MQADGSALGFQTPEENVMDKYPLFVGVMVALLIPWCHATAENMHSGFDDLSQWRDDSSTGSPT